MRAFCWFLEGSKRSLFFSSFEREIYVIKNQVEKKKVRETHVRIWVERLGSID